MKLKHLTPEEKIQRKRQKQNAATKRWEERNPDGKLKSRLKCEYGIDLETFKFILESQEGKCAICELKPIKRELDVDHDHTSMVVRGLLCNNCNRGIGHLKDDIQLLKRAIEYLELYQQTMAGIEEENICL